MEHNDRNLIEAHLSGSAEAFETIVRRHGPAVYGYLVKMVKDTNKADDLFQETFQKVYENIGDFRGVALKPWIHMIATNAALTVFRKEKRRYMVSLNGDPSCPDGKHCLEIDNAVLSDQKEPSEILEIEEKRHSVRQALLKLPDQQRTTLILSYYQKLTYKQIAETLNCSIGTVKTNMFRALKRLAVLLPESSGGQI